MKDFYSYDENEGFRRHATLDEAEAAAKSALEFYKDNAADGWPEETTEVCYGAVLGVVVETARKGRCLDVECDGECEGDVHHSNDYDEWVEYALKAVEVEK